MFRYALKESQDSDCAPGGQGEIGGNDFVVFNSDNAGFTKEGVFWPGGQTFMHELGHNLGLLHGGFQNRNHKPNYVSLMNYRYSFTLQEAGGDGYLDFSPAVAPDGEGARPALMPPFAESAPPQGQVLGADRDHLIRYPDLTCLPTSIAATDAFDLQPAEPGPDEPVPHPGSDAYFKDLPDSCTTALASGATQTHEDHDDWSAISLPFREDGDSADGPINPSDDEDLPTDDEIDLLRAQATTSNLKVALAGPATPVQVGSPALVRVTAANAGNVHSATPVITVEMPPGVVVTTIPPACAGNPLVCTSPPLAPGATTTFDLEIRPTAPGSLVVRASLADPRLADSTPADNTAEATVTAVSASTPTPTPTATPTPTPTSTSPALPPTPAPSTSGPGHRRTARQP